MDNEFLIRIFCPIRVGTHPNGPIVTSASFLGFFRKKSTGRLYYLSTKQLANPRTRPRYVGVSLAVTFRPTYDPDATGSEAFAMAFNLETEGWASCEYVEDYPPGREVPTLHPKKRLANPTTRLLNISELTQALLAHLAVV